MDAGDSLDLFPGCMKSLCHLSNWQHIFSTTKNDISTVVYCNNYKCRKETSSYKFWIKYCQFACEVVIFFFFIFLLSKLLPIQEFTNILHFNCLHSNCILNAILHFKCHCEQTFTLMICSKCVLKFCKTFFSCFRSIPLISVICQILHHELFQELSN